MGGALADTGLARLPSRVFAALTVDEDGRMTSAELSDALGVSPAAVSGAVKALTQVNLIHRERERGSRRDVYVVDDDTFHVEMMHEGQLYAPMMVAIEEALAALPADHEARPRLTLMLEFLRFVSRELASLGDKWERHRAAFEGRLRLL